MKSDRVSGTEMLASSLPKGVIRIVPSATALIPCPVKSKQNQKQIKKRVKTPTIIWRGSFLLKFVARVIALQE